MIPVPFQWEYSAFPVTVTGNRLRSPGFRRITLAGPDLRRFAPWGLDQRIKLVLPMPDGSHPEFGLLDRPTPHPREWYSRWKQLPADRRNVLRTYTPAAIRPEQGEIDVDMYLHDPPGPASRWAADARPGDTLVITGPESRVGYTGYGLHYRPPAPPSRVLLIGDESALPAMANIAGSVAPGTGVEALLELADPADDLLSGTSPCLSVTRPEPEAVPGAALVRAAREWARGTVIDPGLFVWVAGEATATTTIRRSLTQDLGVAKEQVAFLGYWKLGGPLVG